MDIDIQTLCKNIKLASESKAELAIIYNENFEMIARWSNKTESPVIIFSTDDKMSGVDVGYLYLNQGIKVGFSLFIRNHELSAESINKAIKQLQHDLNLQANTAYFDDGMKEQVTFANCNQIVKQFCERYGYYIENYKS